MNLLFGAFLVLGILCLLYYCIITIYAGVGTAFAWFWICAGLGFLLLSVIIRYIMSHGIKLPALVRFLFLGGLCVGICIFILLEGTIIYYSTKQAKAEAEYLIVLGAQVKGTVVSKSLKKRLDTAIDYLEENPKTRVIVSGGQGPGEYITEAEAMMRYLAGRGIAQDRIIKEDRSTSTYENIRFSKLLMEDEEASLVIVTNGFHVFRALSIAKKQGLTKAEGLAAPSDRLLILNYYVREAAGLLKDFVFGNI